MTYRDIPVKDPYLLTMRLVNVGPADVASSHFDGGRDLDIDLGCTMYGLLRPPTGDGTLTTVSTAVGSSPGVISLQPGLLRRGSEWMVDVVVSGMPSPTLDNPLIDTDVVDPPTYRMQLASSVAWRAAKAALTAVPGVEVTAAALSVVSDAGQSRRGRLGNG